MFIKTFQEIGKSDVKIVGGKGASLGEMTNAGIPVPPGFVVIAEAYNKFLKHLPNEIEEEILRAFDVLGADRVAVRSSAIAEDSTTTSWAGQLESYLNVTRDDLISAIKKCWDSIKSERAISYASQNNVPEENLAVAVVVQKMVESESAGVAFSVNPVTCNPNEIMIEGSWGLGEMVVQGQITPDNFIVDKNNLEIKNRNIAEKEKMLTFKDEENQEVSVSEEKRGQPVLFDEQIKELATLAVKIENHYGKPQDIEWAMELGKIYIVQSRPITTL